MEELGSNGRQYGQNRNKVIVARRGLTCCEGFRPGAPRAAFVLAVREELCV